jgi:methyltransferase
MFWLEVIVAVIVVQRLSELVISRRNMTWALRQGGIESDRDHYWMFFVLHVGWLASFIVEWHLGQQSIPWYWPAPAIVWVGAQVLRYWAIVTLGRRWNTRIVVIPGLTPVSTGPYRILRHPNYLAVAAEIASVPMLLGAWITAIVFSLLNAFVLLRIRIPKEETALRSGPHLNVQREVPEEGLEPPTHGL